MTTQLGQQALESFQRGVKEAKERREYLKGFVKDMLAYDFNKWADEMLLANKPTAEEIVEGLK